MRIKSKHHKQIEREILKLKQDISFFINRGYTEMPINNNSIAYRYIRRKWKLKTEKKDVLILIHNDRTIN